MEAFIRLICHELLRVHLRPHRHKQLVCSVGRVDDLGLTLLHGLTAQGDSLSKWAILVTK